MCLGVRHVGVMAAVFLANTHHLGLKNTGLSLDQGLISFSGFRFGHFLDSLSELSSGTLVSLPV